MGATCSDMLGEPACRATCHMFTSFMFCSLALFIWRPGMGSEVLLVDQKLASLLNPSNTPFPLLSHLSSSLMQIHGCGTVQRMPEEELWPCSDFCIHPLLLFEKYIGHCFISFNPIHSGPVQFRWRDSYNSQFHFWFSQWQADELLVPSMWKEGAF